MTLYALELLVLQRLFVRNGKLFPAFGPAGSKYSSAVGGGHSFTEPVLVFSLPLRWLESAFHVLRSLPKKSGCKDAQDFQYLQGQRRFLTHSPEIPLFCSTSARCSGRLVQPVYIAIRSPNTFFTCSGSSRGPN